MLRLALRNVLRHRLRTGLTLAAIGSGVAGLVLSGGFVEDSLLQLREATIHSQLGHVQIHRADTRRDGSQAQPKSMIDDPQEIMSRVKRLPQVDDVMARITFEAVLNNGRADIPVQGIGMEPDKEARLGTSITMIAGRGLRGEGAHEILLGEGVANASKLKPGDRATLLTNSADGALNTVDLEVAGVFRTFSKDYDARVVRISLAAAQELLDVRAVNAIVISLKTTEATNEVAALLRGELDNGAYKTSTWEQLADFYDKTSALYRRQFAVLQVIILIAVLLSVANSVNMSIFERTGEFGTLMALGSRGRMIFRLAIAENLLLGLMGSGGGVFLGMLLAWGISVVGIPMPPPPNSNAGYTASIRIVPWVVLSSLLGRVSWDIGGGDHARAQSGTTAGGRGPAAQSVATGRSRHARSSVAGRERPGLLCRQSQRIAR